MGWVICSFQTSLLLCVMGSVEVLKSVESLLHLHSLLQDLLRRHQIWFHSSQRIWSGFVPILFWQISIHLVAFVALHGVHPEPQALLTSFDVDVGAEVLEVYVVEAH